MMTSTVLLVTCVVTMATLSIIEAAQPEYCSLLKVTGPCRASIPRFYFDSTTGECQSFIYGGCRGNENNFVSESECKAACVCTLDSNSGTRCRWRLRRRFYYDLTSATCKAFRYGGCGGNGNRFNQVGTCLDACENAICFLPPETGPCKAAFSRFYYDKTSRTCKTFTYGGCGGNENRFSTEADCQNRCAKPIQLQRDTETGTGTTSGGETGDNICMLPKVTGPCRARFRRFYYNSATQLCEMFTYGGCQGNQNNFATSTQCYSRCGTPTLRSSPESNSKASRSKRGAGLTEEDCNLPPDQGPCKAYMPSFYYNSATGRCEQLIYGGCRGNKNRFPTEQSCLDACSRFNVKVSSSILGGGLQGVQKFQDHSVKPSIFELMINNLRSMLGLSPVAYHDQRLYKPMGTEIRQKSDSVISMVAALKDAPYNKPVCGLPRDPGDCHNKLNKFFFNTETLECEPFVYGGCGGNGNQFESKSWCETICKKTKPSSPEDTICRLPAETGMCRAYFPKFHYNATSGQCEEFVYGGCGGNDNKFDTVDECKKMCGGVKPITT